MSRLLALQGLALAALPTAPAAAGEAVQPRAILEPGPRAPARRGDRTYTVRPGDSVSREVARHGIPSPLAIGANRPARPDALRPGQQLRLPGCRAGGRTAVRGAQATGGPHHVHFEIRREGAAYDPLHRLPDAATALRVARIPGERPGDDD